METAPLDSLLLDEAEVVDLLPRPLWARDDHHPVVAVAVAVAVAVLEGMPILILGLRAVLVARDGHVGQGVGKLDPKRIWWADPTMIYPTKRDNKAVGMIIEVVQVPFDDVPRLTEGGEETPPVVVVVAVVMILPINPTTNTPTTTMVPSSQIQMLECPPWRRRVRLTATIIILLECPPWKN
jgi:hypothetical protein